MNAQAHSDKIGILLRNRNSMINILIADDHTVLMDGFISIFKSVKDFNVVASAKNGQEVLDILEQSDEEINIALLDINMPLLNGVETCKQINKRYPTVKVIALSMYKQSSFIKRMKQNGAMGYILKDDSADTIIKGIYEVNEGREFYSEQLKDILYNQVFKNQSFNSGSTTKREKEVLELISQGMTNKEISEKLFVSDHTIISHRKNLILKFGAKNTADLVRIAMEKGLI